MCYDYIITYRILYDKTLKKWFAIEGLKEDIQTQLGLYFPNILISSLDVLSSPDTNQITVDFTYSIANTGITDELSLSFI